MSKKAAELNLTAAKASLLEIQKQMKETLEGQVAKANEADSQRVAILAHKTMIERLAAELGKIKASCVEGWCRPACGVPA